MKKKTKVSVAISNSQNYVGMAIIVKAQLFSSPQSQTDILRYWHHKLHLISLNGTVVKGSYISKVILWSPCIWKTKEHQQNILYKTISEIILN